MAESVRSPNQSPKHGSLGRLHVRQTDPVQSVFLLVSSESQETLVPVRDSALENIFWWLIPSNFLKGVPLHPEPQVLVFTDASIEGLGVHSGDRKLSENGQRQIKSLK